VGRPRRLLARNLAVGFASGLLLGLIVTGFTMMLSGRRDLHEIPLWNYLFLWPVIGMVTGYLVGRASEPLPDNLSEDEQEKRRRRRRRFVAAGFGIGLVIGVVSTLVDLAWRGWFILPEQLVLNLVLFPYFGTLLGFNLSRVPGEPKWSWRFFRFNMRTMMVVVAYVALLFGLGVESGRIGRSAKQYHQQYVNAKEMVNVFGGVLRKEQAQAPIRLRSAERLRNGEIPAEIMQGQKDFLKSLDTDPKVTPEYRKYRYGLIADGEELLGRQSETNIGGYTTLVDYFSKLAAKYKQAQQKPWLPVEPDPPRP
jgi:hypothetical protein